MFSFDSWNRFEHVFSLATLEYTGQQYDGLGRCVSRTGTAGATYFFYDGINVIEEYDSSGNQIAAIAHGASIDEYIFRWSAGYVLCYYHQDGMGNVTKLTDTSGVVVEQMSYDAFGSPAIFDAYGLLRSTSFYGNRYLYTGREYNHEFEIYDYRSRIYSPEIGRFLQPDPIGFLAGDMNIYRYVANNPINRVDPLGLFSPTDEAAAREMLKDPPKFPLHGPKTEQAVKWLNQTHPELGLDNFIIINHPLPGDTAGNAIIPGVVLIDESKHDNVSDIVETLVHEPMHPLYQWYPWEPIFDEWLGGLFHEYISDKAHEIEREYEREQKRKNCP